jgi:hypothetical protein
LKELEGRFARRNLRLTACSKKFDLGGELC